MIKIMLIGIIVCWAIFAFAPILIKYIRNYKKGDKSEE